MTAFNKLTAAEAERLALLLEELGEAQQAIGKILRHGYESVHPVTRTFNRDELQKELGDVRAALYLMGDAGDISWGFIEQCANDKLRRVGEYLHHQKEPT